MACSLGRPADNGALRRQFRTGPLLLLLIAVCTALVLPRPTPAVPRPARPDHSGQNLRLSYLSKVDQTQQPYRVYVPSSYDGRRPTPLVIILHGTGGNESSLFEDQRIPPGTLERVAEKHGVLVVSPLGRGTTEYRGIGENDVFCVLEDVKERFRVDPDRVYLTGQSMGGTGAAYLALHHPDLFAAVAPLAAAYSWPWLADNAKTLPFWWIQGADDEAYYLQGVDVGVARMRELGTRVRRDLIPGEAHPAGIKRLDEVFTWLLEQRRVSHPREFTFEVDTPLHGRAWWVSVDAMAQPGKMALIRGQAAGGNAARITTTNVADFQFIPDSRVFDLGRPIRVIVDGARVFTGAIPSGQELRVTGGPANWRADAQKQQPFSWTAYRTHPVAAAPETLEMVGVEKRLANWITDAMRHTTGADIAIYNTRHYRGLPVPQGTVDIVDLIHCSRPFDQYLVTAELTGKDLLDILEDNLPDPRRDQGMAIDKPGAGFVIQLSGARYTFDLARPAGQRIVESDLNPNRVYSVAMEGQVVERETIHLAGRFRKLAYNTTSVPITLALYGYAAKMKRIEAHVEGRVRRNQ